MLDDNEAEDEGDGIATPVPTVAGAPRCEPRYTVTGYEGVWRLVADLTTGREPVDVARARGADSILAALGGRLVELERAG